MNEQWIRMLDAAYDLAIDDQRWLASLAQEARSAFDCGLGVVAYFFDASSDRVRTFGYESAGAASALELFQEVNSLQLEKAFRTAYRSPSALHALWSATLPFGKGRLLRVPRGRVSSPARLVFLTAKLTPQSGCILGTVDTEPAPKLWRRRVFLSHVAKHIAGGLRLRRRLAELSATARTASNVLREKLLEIERVPKQRSSSGTKATLEFWDGLLHGHWSLVDRFERDGRRFVFAHREQTSERSLRALTPSERQVVLHAASARPNKLIAADLGLSLGTVATHLHSALRKLGLASRLELVRLAAESASEGALTPCRIGHDEFVVLTGSLQTPNSLTDLTPAERSLLASIVGGSSNCAIARDRRTSVRTVSNQITGLFRKLGVRSRGELTRFYSTKAASGLGAHLIPA